MLQRSEHRKRRKCLKEPRAMIQLRLTKSHKLPFVRSSYGLEFFSRKCAKTPSDEFFPPSSWWRIAVISIFSLFFLLSTNETRKCEEKEIFQNIYSHPPTLLRLDSSAAPETNTQSRPPCAFTHVRDFFCLNREKISPTPHMRHELAESGGKCLAQKSIKFIRVPLPSTFILQWAW